MNQKKNSKKSKWVSEPNSLPNILNEARAGASDCVVIGDGWAALNSVAGLSLSGQSITWIAGTGGRMTAPLNAIEYGACEPWIQSLCTQYGIECGENQQGSFLREFRNKSFREPVWNKAPIDAREETRNEELWIPETRFVACSESRFEMDLQQIEEQLRVKVLERPNVKRIEGVPIAGFKTDSDSPSSTVTGVILGSGEEISASRVIYADRWAQLGELSGLPKPLSFARGREPMGVLQVSLTHVAPITAGVGQGFFGVLHKDAGETFERRVFGYFSADGLQSFWTVFLAGEESEDNHEIAKKLRRLKQALDRMFTGSGWFEGEFTAQIKNEQVRFEESLVFGAGEPVLAPLHLNKGQNKRDGIEFVTDGYGICAAICQVIALCGFEISAAAAVVAESGLAESPADASI